MNQRVVICTLAYGGWYSRGVARMIEEFHRVSPGFEIQAWVNVLPEYAEKGMILDHYDYTAYAAKPQVLEYARESGADIAILLDAAFYPICPIHPLIEHAAQNGYYLCRNGNNVGEWSSDRCLEYFYMDRGVARQIEEISSYCVGLNLTNDWPECAELLRLWCRHSNSMTIPGHHENALGPAPNVGRNPGFVSADSGVKGHRHDQTVLSIIAHQLGMNKLSNRPYLTAYKGSEDETTVLVNQGLG